MKLPGTGTLDFPAVMNKSWKIKVLMLAMPATQKKHYLTTESTEKRMSFSSLCPLVRQDKPGHSNKLKGVCHDNCLLIM